MNFFRHLKWNEKKFNGTLNDTRFGLKARVSFSFKRKDIYHPWKFQGPAAAIALKLLEDPNKDEYSCAFLESPVTDLSHYRKIELIYTGWPKRQFTEEKIEYLRHS